MEKSGGGEGDGGGVVIARRITLLEQMSAVQDRRHPLAGLTLDAILANKRPLPPPMPTSPSPAPAGRTLLDIIRDEDPNGKTFGHKDRKSWKLFRDRLRIKRAGAAWTSSVNVPTSDIPIRSASLNISNPRLQLSRRSSVRFQTNPAGELTTQLEDSVSTNNRGPPPQFTRRCLSRVSSSSPFPTESTHHEDSPYGGDGSPRGSPSRSSRPQFSRHNSTRVAVSNPETDENSADPFEVAREGTRRLAVALAHERALSAREAVASQEAAEAEAEAEAEAVAAAEAASAEEEASVHSPPEAVPQQALAPRMSLMDLLEETDRQMGVEGSRYTVGDEEEEEEEEEEQYEEEGDEVEENVGGIEHNCCVCMVRHKGSAFIPCGHTFCRLCSRELWVQRGNCPLCNGFILEILDIF